MSIVARAASIEDNKQLPKYFACSSHFKGSVGQDKSVAEVLSTLPDRVQLQGFTVGVALPCTKRRESVN